MDKRHSILNTEKGSVTVVSLMILAIVSITGALTLDQSGVEVNVASYDRAAKETFYQAEGAAMQVAQLIEDTTPENLQARGDQWLNDGNDNIDFTNSGQWTDDQTDSSNELDATYAANDMGIAPGSSLIVTETSLHRFSVFGLSESAITRKLIEMDYRRRF